MKKTKKEKHFVHALFNPSPDGNEDLIGLFDRPPTHLSTSQGDHVSAYRLICQLIYAALEDCPPKEAFSKMISLLEGFKSLTVSSQKMDFFEIYGNLFLKMTSDNRYMSSDKIEALEDEILHSTQQRKKEINNIINTQTYLRLDLFANLADSFLKTYNKLPNVTYPPEGNVTPPANEGARVKKAMKTLKTITAKLAINNTPPTADDRPKLATAIFHLFWYPKIPEDILFDFSKNFDREKWGNTCKLKKYPTGTLPRNNDLTLLSRAITAHIELAFLCFPSLHGSEQNIIIENFITDIAKTGKIGSFQCNWGMNDTELNRLKEEVFKELPLYYNDFIISASDEETTSPSQSDNDQTPPEPNQISSDEEIRPRYPCAKRPRIS